MSSWTPLRQMFRKQYYTGESCMQAQRADREPKPGDQTRNLLPMFALHCRSLTSLTGALCHFDTRLLTLAFRPNASDTDFTVGQHQL